MIQYVEIIHYILNVSHNKLRIIQIIQPQSLIISEVNYY